jgi:hypothetical protein
MGELVGIRILLLAPIEPLLFFNPRLIRGLWYCDRPIGCAGKSASPARLPLDTPRGSNDDIYVGTPNCAICCVALRQRRPRRLAVEVADRRAIDAPWRRIGSRPLNASRARDVGSVEAFQQILLVRFSDHEQVLSLRIEPVGLLFGIL